MDAFDNENRNSNDRPNSNDKIIAEGGLQAFDAAQPAPEFAPLPPGVYVARVVRGEVCQTKAGTDAYRIRFEVIEGPHAGRTVIRTWTFSERALPYTKRDLGLFGLTTTAQLLAPFPPVGKEFRVRLVVVLQRDNSGVERNDVKKLDLIRVVESPIGEFLLSPPQPEGGSK
jgi:hypothetical protein